MKITKEEPRARFSEFIARNEADLELDRATLLIAAEQYPHLQIEAYLRQLDAFAETARARDDLYADPLRRVLRMNELLFEKLGFQGNSENYYDIRNSFLNDVIDRRTGIPITLSVIYLEVARRIGLKLAGVGLPGHFLVKYSDERGEIIIDPFHHGRILTEDQCREMINEIYNGEMKFRLAFLQSTPRKQILARILQNLKGIYARAMDHPKTLGAIERILLINPDSTIDIRDRGLVYFALERYVQARTDLEEYLRRMPAAEDAGEIKKWLSQIRQRQAQLN